VSGAPTALWRSALETQRLRAGLTSDAPPALRMAVMLVLNAAAFACPRSEIAEFGAVFPGQVEEFFGGEWGCFFAQVGFEAPLQVGAFPGLEVVTAGGDPVVCDQIKHEIWARSRRSLTNESHSTNRKCVWRKTHRKATRSNPRPTRKNGGWGTRLPIATSGALLF